MVPVSARVMAAHRPWKRKSARSARGAQQHRDSFANGLAHWTGHAARDGLNTPPLSRRICCREQQSAQLATTSCHVIVAVREFEFSGMIRHTAPLCCPIGPVQRAFTRSIGKRDAAPEYRRKRWAD